MPVEHIEKRTGRPPGSPNKITAEVRAVLSDWAIQELSNISDLYSKLSHKERARFITNILPFIVPKMKEVDFAITDLPDHAIEAMIKRLMDAEAE
jgi:hypothetical protein